MKYRGNVKHKHGLRPYMAFDPSAGHRPNLGHGPHTMYRGHPDYIEF